MSVVNSAFALKRARPLGSCVPFKRSKTTEVASYQSWEWRCKPRWLARKAPPPTLRAARRLMPTVSRRSKFPSASWKDRRRARSAGDQSHETVCAEPAPAVTRRRCTGKRVAPTPAVSCAAPAPLIEYAAPVPAVTDTAPVAVSEHVAPASG